MMETYLAVAGAMAAVFVLDRLFEVSKFVYLKEEREKILRRLG